MRLLLLTTLLGATPALASGVEIRPAVELTWTPGAEDPLGGAVAIDVVATAPGPRPLQLGGGVRVEGYSVRGAQLTVEPVVGLALVPGYPTCGVSVPWSMDLRPGLTFRTDGGPALSLASVASVSRHPGTLRLRASTAVALKREPRWAARTALGPFEDTTLSLGGGVVLGPYASCLVRSLTDAQTGPPPLTRQGSGSAQH